MMTDPIADLLTRIRNALRNRRKTVVCPASKMKKGVLDTLVREGYILGYETEEAHPVSNLRIRLKYGPNGEMVLSHIKRVSKPGCRVYKNVNDMPKPLTGLGICILTTNKGVLSNRECLQHKVGGEVLAEIW